MLVLTRRMGERIVLRNPEGRVITLTLVDIDRNKARLGFEGDRDVVINREEVDCPSSQAEG